MFNVAKSPAPAGTIDYTDFAIADKVKKDFHYKCYLCEEASARHLEIDHFFPKSLFPEQTHYWDNLFSGCSKCNKIKSSVFNTDPGKHILNCCTEDVEAAITLRYNLFDSSVTIIANEEEDKKINTFDLLNRIYNGVGTSSMSYFYLRDAVASQLAELRKKVDDYRDYPSVENKQKIKDFLSRKSAFTAIKRTLINDFNPEFTELFD
jgi:HNH endonuclease